MFLKFSKPLGETQDILRHQKNQHIQKLNINNFERNELVRVFLMVGSISQLLTRMCTNYNLIKFRPHFALLKAKTNKTLEQCSRNS